MAYSFPIEIYTQIEASIGKETARLIAVSVEQGVAEMQREASSLAQQKKLEVREELLKELASKADIALLRSDMNTLRSDMAALRNELLGEINTRSERTDGKINALREEFRGEIKALEARLDRKFTILMVIMIVSVYITNQSTIAFILKVFGVLK
jgi:hypothetical protein